MGTPLERALSSAGRFTLMQQNSQAFLPSRLVTNVKDIYR